MQKRVRVITFFIIAVLATTLLPNSGMYAKAELGEEKETLEIELGSKHRDRNWGRCISGE